MQFSNWKVGYTGTGFMPMFLPFIVSVCDGGKFTCQKISITRVLPPELPSICPPNSEYSECTSNCPITCENMNNPPSCSQDGCKTGCDCLTGFVKDGDQCVNATMCPCTHAGVSYYEGESYKQDCNEWFVFLVWWILTSAFQDIDFRRFLNTIYQILS